MTFATINQNVMFKRFPTYGFSSTLIKLFVRTILKAKGAITYINSQELKPVMIFINDLQMHIKKLELYVICRLSCINLTECDR